MYTQISIKNLKVFKEEQKLKIAPITLLYGENSSGKTSILKTFDIIHNIFSEGEVKRGKSIGQKDTPFYRNDNIQNISAKNIHYYSNQINKKKIEISFAFDVFTKTYKRKRRHGAILFPMNVKLEISYLKDKEISKVTNINIKDDQGVNIISLKRIKKENPKIDQFFDRDLVGYLSPSFNKMLTRPGRYSSVYNRGRAVAEEDFFVDGSLYADYEINITDTSTWDNIYKNYELIFSKDKLINERFLKISKIIDLLEEYRNISLKSKVVLPTDYKNFAYLISKIVLFDEKRFKLEDIIKNLENPKFAKKIEKYRLLEKKKFHKLTFELSYNKKLSEEEKRFLRENLFSERLSRSENINRLLLKNLFKKKISKYNFIRFGKNDQSLFRLRFYKKGPNLSHSIIRENGRASETTFEYLFYISEFIGNGINYLFDEIKLEDSIVQVFTTEYTSDLIRQCFSEIRRTVNNFIICNPSKTNVDWFVARKNDLPRDIIKKIHNASEKERKEDIFRGRSILAKQDEEVRKEANNKLKDKIEADPSEIASNGRNFVSIVANNNSLRRKLNKHLKKLLNLEVKVVTPKFLAEILKNKDKYNMYRNAQRYGAMYPVGAGRLSKTKFLLIRDLKFGKSFEIHGDEIGKGPSNILPFIAQVLSTRPFLTYIIQELENNWHPKYQSKVIKFLVERMKDSQKIHNDFGANFLLETHSELFVLQLKKLVQKGILKPSDVSINYIKRNENGNSQIHHLPLNDQGGFEKQWPGGFFTERMEILTS